MAPAHRLIECQGTDRLRQDLGENLYGRATNDDFCCPDVLVVLSQFAWLNTLAPAESENRLGRISVSIKSCSYPWATDFLDLILLPLLEDRKRDDQPPRGAQGGSGRFDDVLLPPNRHTAGTRANLLDPPTERIEDARPLGGL